MERDTEERLELARQVRGSRKRLRDDGSEVGGLGLGLGEDGDEKEKCDFNAETQRTQRKAQRKPRNKLSPVFSALISAFSASLR
jgi:hypothetical protein